MSPGARNDISGQSGEGPHVDDARSGEAPNFAPSLRSVAGLPVAR